MQVQKTTFEGAAAVELKTKALRLVAVTEFGPRIAFLGAPRGENLLLWKPGKYRRGDWDLGGGHRVWVTRPGADENEDTYAPDNAPADVRLLKNGFRLTGARSPLNATRRGIEVRALSEDTLEVDNFVVNDGDMLYSGGIWALTCTVPLKGTRYAIPVGDGTEWDAFTMVMFRRWAGHGQGGFNDPQFSIQGGDLLVINPRGKENKRMLQAHRGLLAMCDPARKVTFAKRVLHVSGDVYPLGCNIAAYIGPKNFMVEMETMGPEKTLRPGEEFHHVEMWKLSKGTPALRRAQDLLAFLG